MLSLVLSASSLLPPSAGRSAVGSGAATRSAVRTPVMTLMTDMQAQARLDPTRTAATSTRTTAAATSAAAATDPQPAQVLSSPPLTPTPPMPSLPPLSPSTTADGVTAA